jgi:phosphoenolpyruvate synthase/pyruvate phosphate dikinase
MINLINVMYMYVVKDIVRIVTYRDTLEYILVINLINVMYVVKEGYNGMPLYVMEQPPRFFPLAYRASEACIYQ